LCEALSYDIIDYSLSTVSYDYLIDSTNTMAMNNAPQWAIDLLRRVEALEVRLEAGSGRRKDRLLYVFLFDGKRLEYRT
jgi:hypothetical protein